MKKLNGFKIYSLALYYLLLTKRIKHKFHFNTSGIENLAIGIIMTKIKCWRFFIRKGKMEKRIIFNKLKSDIKTIIENSLIKCTLYFGNPSYLKTTNEQMIIEMQDPANGGTGTGETKAVPIEDIGSVSQIISKGVRRHTCQVFKTWQMWVQ